MVCFIYFLHDDGTYSKSEGTRANACMTCYDLNGPNNVNMQLDVAAKRELIANYIGVVWME